MRVLEFSAFGEVDEWFKCARLALHPRSAHPSPHSGLGPPDLQTIRRPSGWPPDICLSHAWTVRDSSLRPRLTFSQYAALRLIAADTYLQVSGSQYVAAKAGTVTAIARVPIPPSPPAGRSRRFVKVRTTGEVDEWFKSHAWKACVR